MVTFLVLFTCLTLFLAHSEPAAHHMGAVDEAEMGGVITMCLAILEVGSMVAAGLVSLIIWRRRRAVSVPGSTHFESLLPSPGCLRFRIRAGPEDLQVFRH